MTVLPFTRFVPGDFLPSFRAQSPVNPRFEFDAVAGRNVILCFIGSGSLRQSARAVATLRSVEAGLHRRGILIYLVTADSNDRTNASLESEDRRTMPFWDQGSAIHRLYGMMFRETAEGRTRTVLRQGCFVVGKNLRLTEFLELAPAETFAARLLAAVDRLPAPAPLAPVGGHAPVLQIPEVFDRDLCRDLIAAYDADGGAPSGVMRDVNGITTGFFDTAVKRRQDAMITDRELLARVRRSLGNRVVGEIRKVHAFDACRIERFIVGCYDAGDRGYFKAHRDNGGPGTAHRRFAVTINLNAEDFDGGELWFPEYGPHLYKPATGAALVFSCSMLHEARPVTAGRRYAFLPFLFDVAAARIREANRGLLNTDMHAPRETPAA